MGKKYIGKIKYKYILPFAAFSVFVIICFSSIASFAEPLDKTIAGLQNYLNGVNDFEAYFEQSVKLQSFDEKQKSTGKVYIKKPGMMRWEYQKPDIQTIFISKQQVWIYTPEDQQAIKTELGELNSSAIYDLFLSDKVKINEIFDFFKGKGKAEKTLVLLELRPKNKDVNIKKIVLELENSGYQIKSFASHDKMGNVTKVKFVNAIINRRLDSNIFDFKVPDNVEIITSEDLGVSP